MTSFNTVIYPTQESNVTNVVGDHLTFHTRDIIIIHYHLHPAAAVASPDHHHAGAAGDDNGAFRQAVQRVGAVGAPGSVWGWFLSIFGL
ncbi:hypothetical protein FIBSPDRAFT_1042840 [Athelia psychrophila]|uniref:Uncharacterized protein n=1 Tax=Athelia psychrophila TaxID=1759441 RepID=A0A166M6T9_9AGAM|nr:hypothetical protein FIBSPDRAFT_1042840 [Fibularhizoctonia sp. CBS 109695]